VTVVDLSDEMASSEDPIGDVAVRDQLERAFKALSHDHRDVVVLHHYVGLPLGEIADVLNIPYGTVGSRLHHAMRSMRATIDAAERTTVRGGQPA
jgi:RNA polymerase sigma-70 factor (ECF subfamily)